MNSLKKLFNPDRYQGKNRQKHYFEGWYFKIADKDCHNMMAFIPGIAMGDEPDDTHAFIQVLDATRQQSYYFRFEPSQFTFSEEEFFIRIGENTFDSHGMEVALTQKGVSFKGRLEFINTVPYPKTTFSPGIMGPFSFMPFMECYHGVIHIHHHLIGSLRINGVSYDFTNGTGYIEKDWGSSFPKSWVWMQCSHFSGMPASFMLSYARIPFLGSSFKGLIAFIQTETNLYRLATYRGARVTHLDYQKNELSIMVENKKYVLSATAYVKPGQALKAPVMGEMVNSIIESMVSDLEISLVEKGGKILFSGKGRCTGIELGGDFDELFE